MNSGEVSVKLDRHRGAAGLGLSIIDSQEPVKTFRISYVKEGSAAHRIGNIRSGDKLLALDGVPVADLKLDDVTKILNAPGDVIQLTIERDSETSKSVKPIHYTVELPTDCGPLGVMIEKSPTSSRRFVVSTITDGCVADQVGALLEGDEVVAINGVQLDDQSLDGALRLLNDRSSAVVTLKIKKEPKRSRRTYNLVNQDSIESSVESWVSTVIRSSSNSHHQTSAERSLAPNNSNNSLELKSNYHHQTSTERSLAPNNSSNSLELKNNSHHQTSAERSLPTSNSNNSLEVTRNSHHQASAERSLAQGSLHRNNSSNSLERLSLSRSNCNNLKINIDQPPITQLSVQSSHPPDTDSPPPGTNPPTYIDSVQNTNPIMNGNIVEEDEWSDQVDDLDFLKPPNDLYFSESFSDLLDGSLTPRQLSPTECDAGVQRRNSNVSHGVAEAEMKEVEQLLDSIFTPTPIELMKIVLYKADVMDNFGFSLSDGLYEKGVYVSGIRPGGPASSGLKEFDKILQVNSCKVKDMGCHQVVRLIAESGNRVEMVISRNALASVDKASPKGSSSKSSIWQHNNRTTPSSLNGNHVDDRRNRTGRKVNFNIKEI